MNSSDRNLRFLIHDFFYSIQWAGQDTCLLMPKKPKSLCNARALPMRTIKENASRVPGAVDPSGVLDVSCQDPSLCSEEKISRQDPDPYLTGILI